MGYGIIYAIQLRGAQQKIHLTGPINKELSARDGFDELHILRIKHAIKSWEVTVINFHAIRSFRELGKDDCTDIQTPCGRKTVVGN